MTKQSWQERGYKDTRERPERNQRRFIPLERTPETDQLIEKARAALATKLGVKAESLSFSRVMREALRLMGG